MPPAKNPSAMTPSTSSPLSMKDLRLINLVSCVTRGEWEELKTLRESAPEGEPDREWREALLQSHLFLGIPRIVEAFEQMATCGGTGEDATEEHEGLDPDWTQRGEPLFDTIYADLATAVRRRLRQHHPDFGAWIAEHAYGRVLSRPGLEPHRRELLAVVCLLLSKLDRQLASHCRGAIRLGASVEQVKAVVESQRMHLSEKDFERLQSVAFKFSNGDARGGDAS